MLFMSDSLERIELYFRFNKYTQGKKKEKGIGLHYHLWTQNAGVRLLKHHLFWSLKML